MTKQALEACCRNYEEAIKLSQSRAAALEKDVKQAERRLNNLIKVVQNNVKKPDILLAQAGLNKETV
jgi:ppGpp synthetase/RelA/SpoT-type nucleotidyltranferase